MHLTSILLTPIQYKENIFPGVHVFSPFINLKLSRKSTTFVSADTSFKNSHNLSIFSSNINEVENKKELSFLFGDCLLILFSAKNTFIGRKILPFLFY